MSVVHAHSHRNMALQVFDRSKTLRRTVSFGENVSCACFLNDDGDILAGLPGSRRLVVVRGATYGAQASGKRLQHSVICCISAIHFNSLGRWHQIVCSTDAKVVDSGILAGILPPGWCEVSQVWGASMVVDCCPTLACSKCRVMGVHAA